MNVINYLRDAVSNKQDTIGTRPWWVPTRVVMVWCTIVASTFLMVASINPYGRSAAMEGSP